MLRLSAALLLVAAASCTHRAASPSAAAAVTAEVQAQAMSAAAQTASAPADVSQPEVVPNPLVAEARVILLPSAERAIEEPSPALAEDEESDPTPDADEGESHEVPAGDRADGPLYTADLEPEQLEKLWRESPEALGSVSFGFVDEGRLLNAVQFPRGDGWTVVSPDHAWGTHETIGYVTAAIQKVKADFPEAPPLRVNSLSSREGGYLRPHKSHQNGRDVDLGFYYPTADPVRMRERERYIDVALNWALIKALVTLTDVQMILVDRRVQQVIYQHALKQGEDPKWLETLFKRGRDSIVQHARRHRDHFHVRFYAGRSQELGRRLAPLLAQRPEQNIAFHRVRSGDTLGGIAVRYGTTVPLLRKANRLHGTLLRVSQVLKVPLVGPCTRCPIPPPVQVPPRRLPPAEVLRPQAAVVPEGSGFGGTP